MHENAIFGAKHETGLMNIIQEHLPRCPGLKRSGVRGSDWRALKHKNDKTPRHRRKNHIPLLAKIPRPCLLPVEDNEQCGSAKYGAKFPGIGSRSPERKQTRGGLGGWRHPRHK